MEKKRDSSIEPVVGDGVEEQDRRLRRADLASLLLAIIGGVTLVWTLLDISQAPDIRRLKLRGVRTPAVVIEEVVRGGGRGKVPVVRYRYSVSDSSYVVGESVVPPGGTFTVGETVEVFYDPLNTEDAELAEIVTGVRSDYMLQVALVLAGGVVCIIASALISLRNSRV